MKSTSQWHIEDYLLDRNVLYNYFLGQSVPSGDIYVRNHNSTNVFCQDICMQVLLLFLLIQFVFNIPLF